MDRYPIRAMGLCGKCRMIIGLRAFSDVNPGDILIFLTQKGKLKCPNCDNLLSPANFGCDETGKITRLFVPETGWVFPVKLRCKRD